MTSRKTLFTLGRKRKPDYVRVFVEYVRGTPMVRVQWTELGRLKTESFDDTRNGKAEARAFAEGKHEQLRAPSHVVAGPVTLAELWTKYVAAKGDVWRPATLVNKTGRWSRFLLYTPAATLATQITDETLDGYKSALLRTPTKHKRPRSVYQVRQHIDVVTAVFRWAMNRKLIPATTVATYQPEFSKDAKRQVEQMSEFSAEDRAKVLAQLNPRDSRQWRAWVLTVLFAYCGPRQRAARHLEWRDIDLAAGTIHWRPELDKMAGERVQPMPTPVLEAFWVAYGWRCAQGYSGPFVFYAPKGTRRERGLPYGAQAYISALHAAEKRAGITSVRYRASHGFRRGIAGDVHAKTGSSKAAAAWIGDKSTRIVEKHYILDRAEELRKTADLVGGE